MPNYEAFHWTNSSSIKTFTSYIDMSDIIDNIFDGSFVHENKNGI